MVIIYFILLINIALSSISIVPEDFETIQDAILEASNGDSIIVMPGVYYENISISNKIISIVSSGGPLETVINGSSSGPVVVFDSVSDSSALLSGFTITNGSGEFINGAHYGGGVLSKYSMPKLDNLVISNNTAFAGGGICYYATSPTDNHPIISNTLIENNLASEGGGVFCVNHLLTIRDSHISANGMDMFGSGGGVQILLSSINFDNVVISQNQTRFGGGIYLASSIGIVKNTTIENNLSESRGGGIWIGGDSNLDIERSLISKNHSVDIGGGAFILSSDLDFINSTLSGNTVGSNTSGAAIYSDGGHSNIKNSIVYFNRLENNFSNPNYNLGGYSGNIFSEYDISYSDIEGNDTPQGEGVINQDPLFVDSSNGNYSLMFNSPCIGTGEGGTDMGRYSYQEFITGDLNGDLLLNILDIVLMVDLVLNGIYSAPADINLDNLINVQDIVLAINLILDA